MAYDEAENQIRQLQYTERPPVQRTFSLAVLLDAVRGPNNVGGVFRLADALGLESVALCGATPVPPNKLLRKAARGAERHVPFQYYATALDGAEGYRRQGFTVVALEITNTSRDLAEVDFTVFSKILLVAGGEKMGVSAPVLQSADLVVHIPMYGMGLSMNVANATAIILYEIVRQWTAAGRIPVENNTLKSRE